MNWLLRPTEQDSSAPARVLLVDDHDLGRRSLARLLSAMGFEVTSVGDGTSALWRPSRLAPTFTYLLTDVRLPDLDGREIVQIARRRDPRPVIALITGWDIDREECDRLGVDWLFLEAGRHPGVGLEAARTARLEPPRLRGKIRRSTPCSGVEPSVRSG